MHILSLVFRKCCLWFSRAQKVGTYLFTLNIPIFSLSFAAANRAGALSFDDIKDFPNFLDELEDYDPDVDFIDALEDVPFHDDEFPDLAPSDDDSDPSKPELKESGVSGVVLKGAAFAGASGLLASGLLAKPFSNIRNMFDDTGDDDLILDMSMDIGDDFNSSLRSMGDQALQESSRNLMTAPLPTGAESTAA
jgi:hypothetical protein